MSNKYCIVLGTRPEIIKFYSMIKYCQSKNLDYFVIHTNQHYDSSMDKVFFQELEIPYPKYSLNVGSGSHAQMTAKMLTGIEEILLTEKPTHILVQGDTNSTMAGALVGSKMQNSSGQNIKIAHIEGGLRSYDRDMPEETNRIIVDHISDYIFPPTDTQKEILINEGIDTNKIIVVGNTIVDAVYGCLEISKTKSNILENLLDKKYFLLTCHRPSNTDNQVNFEEILDGVNTLCIQNNCVCIFPAHPRLSSKSEIIAKYSNIKIIAPTGFLDSLQLQNNAQMIFTDSGGIQEESCILERKTIILRTNTERPESIIVGGAMLLESITSLDIQSKFYTLNQKKVQWYNPFGAGNSANLIFANLV